MRSTSGKLGRKLFLLFCWLFCLIVIAAFADMVAGTFNAYTVVDGVTQLADAAQTNGRDRYSVHHVHGVRRRLRPCAEAELSGWKEAVFGILCIVASFAVGMDFALIFDKASWSYITFVYIFFAAVLPMWLFRRAARLHDDLILIKKGAYDKLPKQISMNGTNIGAWEMFAQEMNIMQQISGLNGAVQGQVPFSPLIC